MKINLQVILMLGVLCAAVGSTALPAGAEAPARLRRADSFLGVHLDFHAQATDLHIGQNTTPEMIHAILDMIQPDYIQIDCKGHPGYSSYPTKVGNHAGSFVGDPLRVWREVTAQRGVALYMHYSGVLDAKAIADHPAWAAVGPDGVPAQDRASLFGPYADEILIPQLLEVATDYQVDGAWIDGDCWGAVVDYCDAARQAFTQQTGITQIPHGPQDPHWFEWTQFQRDAFRAYVRHYVTEIKKHAPAFQIASNWAFSDHMPEPVSCPVDFLSGDYLHYNSVVTARYSSRFLSTQGRPWDLMGWSGSKREDETTWHAKTAIQLMREAACVLAQGGGFEACFPQNRDGSMDLERLRPMAETARFCRARQAVSFQSRAVPQVALLCNTAAHYRHVSQHSQGLFPWSIGWQRPMLNRLLENQYSVEVFTDASLLPVLPNYPLLVICEWEYYEPALQQAVADYVRNGGRLLLVGESIGTQFEALLGTGTIVTESVDGLPLTRLDVGAGRVAVLKQNVSAGNVPASVVRTAVDSLEPRFVVAISGSHLVDVSVRTLPDGRLVVHLVNTSGDHESPGVIDAIDPVGPLAVTIQVAGRPRRVSVAPAGRELDFQYTDNAVHVTLDQLAIHDVIVVE